MIFDMKKKKLYRDLEDWVECNCPVEDCNDCLISFNNNGKKCSCSKFVELYPASTLWLLQDRVKEVQSEIEAKKELEDVKMENMENMVNVKENQIGAVEENTPPLCRLLGVRPYQAFSYEDEEHRIFAIDENGVRYELDTESGWRISYDEENLVKFIQHPERVVPGEDSQSLKELVRQNRLMEVLRKFLPQAMSFEQMDGRPQVQIRTYEGNIKLTEIDLEALEELLG